MPERLTLAEVVEQYRFRSARQLRGFVRRHKIPVLATGRGGNAVTTFDQAAILALEDALRCRSASSSGQTPARSRSAAPSDYRTAGGSQFADVLQQMTAALQPKKPPRSKPRSSATPGTANVVVLAHGHKPWPAT